MSGTTGSQIFTTGNDTVNFNDLTPEQLLEVKAASLDLHNSLGGNDKITLPNKATVTQIPELGGLDGGIVSTGSGNSTIVAGDGSYTIAGVESVGAKGGTIDIGNKTIDGSAGHVTILFPNDITFYKIGYNSLPNIDLNAEINLVISSKDGVNKDTLTGISTVTFNTPSRI